MKNIKYIVMGAATYFASKYLSGFSGISEWMYFIWIGSLAVATAILRSDMDNKEKKSALLANFGVLVIATVTALIIQYFGTNITDWI